ncbi:MAG: hypothetical protein HDP34_00550 [Clostridia bacterium]|nr:hypothetical protein [Clostridia bacterium]
MIAMYRKLYVAISICKFKKTEERIMTFSLEVMLALVTVFSIVTSLATQFVKMFLDTLKVSYASNIVVMVVAAVVGAGGTLLYYVNYQIPLNALTSVYLAIMCIMNCMGAMIGYDKVKQMLEQLEAVGKK